jgi:hypothetical protein
MDQKQLNMILRIIKNSSQPELSTVLRKAMARNRKEVIQEVHNQATPLFEHLIPLVALERKGIPYPSKWPEEINSFLLRIHAKNGSKGSKKRWLEAKDIERLLNEGLIPNLKATIMKKMQSEKYQRKPYSDKIQTIVRDYLSELLETPHASLGKMGVTLKYEGIEEGVLMAFLKGSKI